MAEGTQSAPRQRWRLGLAVLCLCVVHGAFLFETLFGGKILTQIDALCLFEPWASVAPDDFRASNELLLDQSITILPWLEFQRERLAAGELPLWNPHNFAGQPLVGVPPSGLLWPPHWIYFALPSWHFHAWHAFGRLVLAGVFALFFLRELGTSRAAATLGAVGFSLCGFVVMWLNHPHANAAMFLPLFFWFVERAANRRTGYARIVGGLAIPVALALFSGHPQTALQALLATGLYACLRACVGPLRLSVRGLAALAGGVGLGVLIAMPMILPFLDYLRVSMGARVSATTQLVSEVDAATAAGFAVAPDRFGHPQEGTYSGPTGNHLNYQELAGVFAGRLMLGLALLGLALRPRDRRGWVFAGVGLLAALVAYQVPPFYDLMRLVPGVNNTKLLRLVLVVAFAVTVLGALGLDALLERFRGKPRLTLALALALPLLATIELFAWGRGYNPVIERDDPTFLPATPATDFLARDESLFRVLGHQGSTLLPSANIFHRLDVLTGYDSIEYATLVELVSKLSSDPRAETFLKEARVFDRLDRLPLASLLNVKYVLSKDPLPEPLVLVLDGPLRVYENPHVLPRAFVARDWVVLPDKEERLAHLSATDLDPLVAVLEEATTAAARHGLDEPPGEVRLTSYEPRRIELAVEMREPGLVVVADSWDAAWMARVDGEERPIERVDHTLRGVWVEGGSSELLLTHEPRSFTLGAGLAGVGLAAALVLLLRASGRPARAPDE